MADEPEPPNDPPAPGPEPDPPPMPARELAAVIERITDCPWEVAEARDVLRAWLMGLPVTRAV